MWLCFFPSARLTIPRETRGSLGWVLIHCLRPSVRLVFSRRAGFSKHPIGVHNVKFSCLCLVWTPLSLLAKQPSLACTAAAAAAAAPFDNSLPDATEEMLAIHLLQAQAQAHQTRTHFQTHTHM